MLGQLSTVLSSRIRVCSLVGEDEGELLPTVGIQHPQHLLEPEASLHPCSHYCFVMVKLDKTHIQEEAEANTAAKMRTDNHAASSSRNTYVPWWRKKYQCSGYGHGKKNQLKNKSKKDDRKGKGKDEAAQHIKKYTGWDCDHNNCDSNMETPDPVPALCTCYEWGNCSEAACPLGKGSWTPPALETVEYQDGVLGHYEETGRARWAPVIMAITRVSMVF